MYICTYVHSIIGNGIIAVDVMLKARPCNGLSIPLPIMEC